MADDDKKKKAKTKAAAKKKPAAKKVAAKPATKKTAAKKPAKKTVAKKTASAKKPAPKKPAVKAAPKKAEVKPAEVKPAAEQTQAQAKQTETAAPEVAAETAPEAAPAKRPAAKKTAKTEQPKKPAKSEKSDTAQEQIPGFYGTGRRKEATARVFLKPGEGIFVVNKKPMETFFTRARSQMVARQALKILKEDGEKNFNVYATVSGGGESGQAEAVRHGVSRAMVACLPDSKPTLRAAGFIARDARAVERKKVGRRKARRARQYSKR